MNLIASSAFVVALSLVPSWLSLLRAQDERVYTSKDSGVVPPKLTQRAEPSYTEGARTRGVAGSVTLSLEIDKAGKPRNIKVLDRLDAALDKNAVAALNQWRWEPGTKDGQPVVFAAKVAIAFRL